MRDCERMLYVQRRKLFSELLAIGLLMVGFVAIDPSTLSAQSGEATPDSNQKGDLSDIPTQSIRGRVVCLAEEMHSTYDTHLPTNHEHLYGFKTTDGEFYTLLRTKLSEAIFVDERVRDRELVLSVRVIPKSRIIDVVTIKSVKDGVVHDLYYYCFICAIRTVDPAICLCCQEEVEFMEVPLD